VHSKAQTTLVAIVVELL